MLIILLLNYWKKGWEVMLERLGQRRSVEVKRMNVFYSPCCSSKAATAFSSSCSRTTMLSSIIGCKYCLQSFPSWMPKPDTSWIFLPRSESSRRPSSSCPFDAWVYWSLPRTCRCPCLDHLEKKGFLGRVWVWPLMNSVYHYLDHPWNNHDHKVPCYGSYRYWGNLHLSDR